MHRCIQLARQGGGRVAPNPMVGAVLVYNGRIIGEGYHHQYGSEHAEVNCINNVAATDEHLLQQSTLYVSLEPCAHFGKTPPCADLIILKKIPLVVIGCSDPYQEVNGKGIFKLIAAGIQVITPILEGEALKLNRRFFTFHQKKRPYIILKWAQTANGKIAQNYANRLFITNEFTNRQVHRWRSRVAAVMVGTNTALLDNPSLTTRLWKGENPVRLVIDMALKLPPALQLMDGIVKTIVFNAIKHEEGEVFFFKIKQEENVVRQVVEVLWQLNLQSLLVEGGSKLLQSFIDIGCWDEARVITNNSLEAEEGLQAPVLMGGILKWQQQIFSDTICYYQNNDG